MSTRDFLAELADLLLKSEESTKDWVKIKSLRRTWYALCAFTLGILLLHLLSFALESFLSTSAGATLVFRIAHFTIFISLESCLCYLAVSYYKYALSRKATIKLGNVLKMYCMSTLFFALIYQGLYILDQGSLIYRNPPFAIGTMLSSHSFIDMWKMRIDFILFSAFQTVNSSFYRVQVRH
jgi:hypothetical protein